MEVITALSNNPRSPPPRARTERHRTDWATPRKGKRPLDDCRREPAGRKLSHCRRKSSTW